MENNVIAFPTLGKAISPEDEGVYVTAAPTTGMAHSIFRLDFEREWYVHQLHHAGNMDAFSWALVEANANDSMVSMTPAETRVMLDQAEYQNAKGAWQIVRNRAFGFGKFTPEASDAQVQYALIPFVGDEARTPVAIVKADEAMLHQAKAALSAHLKTA